MLKIVRVVSSFLLTVTLFCVFAVTFVSCDEKDAPSVDLRKICKLFPSEQVELTMNGEIIDPAKDINIVFPGTQMPEEEIFESKLSLQILPLWPNCSMSKPASLISIDINSSFGFRLTSYL